MTKDTIIRRGGPADFDAAVEVWRAAVVARRGGTQPPRHHASRVRGHLEGKSSFVFVAGVDKVVGMAAGMQGLAGDGAGPPVDGLCHVGAVFVVPDRWGEGLGGELVDAVLAEARARGFAKAQLWTHADNARAHRLYAGRGFERTSRQKRDDLGETIIHYERDL